jgi:chromosome segregation ATPase
VVDDRDERRIDGLLASYGELMSAISALEAESRATNARMDNSDRERRELREAIAGGLREFDRACDAKVDRLDRKIEKVSTKIDNQALANRWTPTQWAAVLGPTLAAMIGLVAVLVH